MKPTHIASRTLLGRLVSALLLIAALGLTGGFTGCSSMNGGGSGTTGSMGNSSTGGY